MVARQTKTESETEVKVEVKKQKGRPPSGVATFPRDSLKASLEVAKAIRKDSAGEPFDPIQLANSLHTTRRSKVFEYLLRSSERYGLTTGTVFASAISLTNLGRTIVESTNETVVKANLRSALLKPELFSKFYTRYDRKPILRPEILSSRLESEFGVRQVDADDCIRVITKNIEDYDISLVQGKETLLWLNKFGTSIVEAPPEGEKKTAQPEHEQGEEANTQEQKKAPQTPPTQEQVVKVPRVFISHSKNKKILGNVKQTLTFGKFDYRVAEEKETLSMPLSDKVFGLMQECNCAIINISADEEKKQGETYGINENVLIEIGAAFLNYNKRVLLVIDKKLKERLPSILQGLTAIFYEGQELSFNEGMKLMEVLGEFRNKL